MLNNATAPTLYLKHLAFAGRTALAKSYLCSIDLRSSQSFNGSGRPSGYPPGPPQIRTCAIYASGSSVVKIRGAV